jgi:outer membrane protein insertion porin family
MPRLYYHKAMARQISFVLLVLAAVAGTAAHAQAQAFPIDSITVEGNRILSEQGIVAASGLKIGEKAEGPSFDAARDRLLATGYFETVACRFRPSEKAGYEVAFEVQEMQPLYNIRIESLPVTVPEATAWLKGKDPLFTGRIPGTEQVLQRTARELEQYLESKNQPSKVAAKVVLVSEKKYEVQFTPGGGLPNVALVSFEGNKAIRDTDLQNAIAEVAFGQPYTESNFRLLLDNQIRGLYEKSGYMHVTFTKISTTPSTQVKGVDVHVTLAEGEQYKLGEVGVRGPMAGFGMVDQTRHILKVAKIPPMTIADFDQIRAATLRVTESLKHEGYLDVEVSTDREIHDDKKTVDVYIVPNPGPQYMFRNLEVKGLGLDGVEAVEKTWGVKRGEPFPAEYPDYFVKKLKEEGLFDNLGDIHAEPAINAEKHVVDVTLDFTYSSNAPKKKPAYPQP